MKKYTLIITAILFFVASHLSAGNHYDLAVRAIMRIHAQAQDNAFFKALRENTITPQQYLQVLVNDWAIFNAMENFLKHDIHAATLGFTPDPRVYRAQALDRDIVFFTRTFGLKKPNPTQNALDLALKLIKLPTQDMATYYVVLNAGNLHPSRMVSYVQALLIKHQKANTEGFAFYTYQDDMRALGAKLKADLEQCAVEEPKEAHVTSMATEAFHAVLASYTQAMQPAA